VTSSRAPTTETTIAWEAKSLGERGGLSIP
jgi:hypothetical protein